MDGRSARVAPTSFETSLVVVALPTIVWVGVHAPIRRRFFSVLKDADTDTWIAINCPDGIIERGGDDHYEARWKLIRYLWKREYLPRDSARLTSAANRLRISSAITFTLGAAAISTLVWLV